jgi:hypothetical protein
MMRIVVVSMAFALAAVTMATGCSDDGSTLASCSDIYVKGQVVTKKQAEEGCLLKNGSTLKGNACERVDGVLLVTFKKSDPQLWGLVGKPLRAASGGTVDDDPAYTKAVALC